MDFLVVALFLLQESQGFALVGVNPYSFGDGEGVKLKVNKMTSTKTLLPIDSTTLDFCQPPGGFRMDHQNLGEFLAGDRVQSSPYFFGMKVDKYCYQLCIANLGSEDNKSIKAIQNDYHHNWIVDNLSSASKTEDDVWGGFPMGYIENDTKKAYIHNHVNIEIQYHDDDDDESRATVVRFVVEPFSIKHDFEPIEDYDEDDGVDRVYGYNVQHGYHPDMFANIAHPIEPCNRKKLRHTRYEMVHAHGPGPQPAMGQVLFIYDVIWVENKELQWSSRWDIYLSMDDAIPGKVHWASIASSFAVVVILSAIISSVLVRNLRSYNLIAADEERTESIEEVGWKVVHTDVFRPPTFSPLLLAVCCGSGSQILITAFETILFSVFGVLSHAKRGSLPMIMLLLYVLNGSMAGFVTARFYKTFKGESWGKATACAAFGFPGIAFGLFLVVHIMAKLSQSSTCAVPAQVIAILIFLWLGISTPLVFIGAYKGFKSDAIEFPVNTSNISREIPAQSWFRGLPFGLIISGILPYGACVVEMYFILASAWKRQYYYEFGYLLMVFVILVLTCAEVTVLLNFSLLKGENYHWWWRSFIHGGSISFWFFVYSFVYYFKEIGGGGEETFSMLTLVLFFGYMWLVSLGLFLMTGFVGISACLWFNKIMYASIFL
ncbi:hypothetical protein ACHAXR_011630 [Thalassiosira sp. AJA248-18]